MSWKASKSLLLLIINPYSVLRKIDHAAADETSQETQAGTHQPSKPAAPAGSSISPASPQATSPASMLNGVPNGDAPSMPPPVDPNTPKYRFAHTLYLAIAGFYWNITPFHMRCRRLVAELTRSSGSGII